MPTSLNEVQSISASADGSVWAVTKSRQVYKYDANTDRWQPIPGELTNIAVGSASDIWGVSADGKVWKHVGGSTPWDPIPSEAPGRLVQISASSDGEVWGVSAEQLIWKTAAVRRFGSILRLRRRCTCLRAAETTS